MHLSSDTPEINQGFYRYLEQTAQGASALYILGDLFDAWMGDDSTGIPLAPWRLKSSNAYASSAMTARLFLFMATVTFCWANGC